ncbi:MAG: hypothetical protein PVJ57_17615 [Phycisphaerae bacterium]|jgi:hypothetical protein
MSATVRAAELAFCAAVVLDKLDLPTDYEIGSLRNYEILERAMDLARKAVETAMHSERVALPEKSAPPPQPAGDLASEVANLRAENERLRRGLEVHLHTQECLEYAANTARRCGSYYCLAKCADSRRAILGETS